MMWRVLIAGEEAPAVAASDDFFGWLLPQVTDPGVASMIDPYRTSTLDRRSLEQWNRELALVESSHRARLAARFATERTLTVNTTATGGNAALLNLGG